MTKETIRKKVLPITIALLIAFLSLFVLSGIASSPEFHASSIQALEEKQTTVLELTAALAAASTAVSLIPGDTAQPIANQLAELSTAFLIVLCSILLEKYLLTITGSLTFSILIPAACALLIAGILLGRKRLKALAARLAVFGLLIVLLVPASVHLGAMIEDTYETSMEAAIQSAKDSATEIEGNAEGEEGEEGFWSGLFSTVTDAATGVVDRLAQTVNNFLEAIAVMLVTSCVIPILTLLAFVWFAKLIFNLNISLPDPRESQKELPTASPQEEVV